MQNINIDRSSYVMTSIDNKGHVLLLASVPDVFFVDAYMRRKRRQEFCACRRIQIDASLKARQSKTVGRTQRVGLYTKAMNSNGWVAFEQTIWRDNLPSLRLTQVAATDWERKVYSDWNIRDQSLYASALNQDATVVGWSKIHPSASSKPSIWRNGVASMLLDKEMSNNKHITGDTNTFFGEALGLNNKEMVVGWIRGYNQRCAFVWQNGKYHILEGVRLRTIPDDLAETIYETEAVAINGNGVIAGRINDHLVRWQNGVLSFLHSPNKAQRVKGSVQAINQAGVIVGSVAEGNTSTAALWHGQQCIPLHQFLHSSIKKKVKLLCAFGINDIGQIVGTAEQDGKRCGFVLDIN